MKHTHLGVYGLITQKNKCLLIKKARGPYINMFDLPGGKIEFGETPEQALKREIIEETGQQAKEFKLLFCDSIQFQHSMTEDRSTEDLHHIGIIYDVAIENGYLLKASSDGLDSNGAFWFDYVTGDIENLTPFAKTAVMTLRTV